jgi:hypothetical protein
MAIGWMVRGDTATLVAVEKTRAAATLHAAGSMRVESPTAARRPLQPPLARVLWCSKMVDEDRKNVLLNPIGDPQWIAGAFLAVWYVNMPPKS